MLASTLVLAGLLALVLLATVVIANALHERKVRRMWAEHRKRGRRGREVYAPSAPSLHTAEIPTAATATAGAFV
jgi:hypothetical protein